MPKHEGGLSGTHVQGVPQRGQTRRPEKDGVTERWNQTEPPRPRRTRARDERASRDALSTVAFIPFILSGMHSLISMFIPQSHLLTL